MTYSQATLFDRTNVVFMSRAFPVHSPDYLLVYNADADNRTQTSASEGVRPPSLELSNTFPEITNHALPNGCRPTYPTGTEDPVLIHIRHLDDKFRRLEQELALLRSHVTYPGQEEDCEYVVDSDTHGNSTCSSSLREPFSPSESMTEPMTQREFSDPPPEPKRRKYVRKPKVDRHAPVKPLTGYATFANDIRKQYHGLSFADTAAKIGMDWQSMPEELRELYMSNASHEKARYDNEISKYKKTSSHFEHQSYLEEFKQQKLAKIEAQDRTIKRKQEDGLAEDEVES